MFKPIIPNMVNVLEQCIKEEDTDNARKLFEVFDTLLMLVNVLSIRSKGEKERES